MATVGYGGFRLTRHGPGVLTFGMLVIISRVLFVSVVTALFTNVLVSDRLEGTLGRRGVAGMAGRAVVIELGSVGLAVVSDLLGGATRVVEIGQDGSTRYLHQARTLEVSVIIADAIQPQNHREVHLSDAAAVAILTSSELANFDVGLAIRAYSVNDLKISPVAFRIFDQDLARMTGGLRVRAGAINRLPSPRLGRRSSPRSRRAQQFFRRRGGVLGWSGHRDSGQGIERTVDEVLSSRVQMVILRSSGAAEGARAPASPHHPMYSGRMRLSWSDPMRSLRPSRSAIQRCLQSSLSVTGVTTRSIPSDD